MYLLLVAIPIRLAASRSAGFLALFAPDVTWLTRICGSFAGVWIIVRTRLVRASPARVGPKS
jgi:hypothetical protein